MSERLGSASRADDWSRSRAAAGGLRPRSPLSSSRSSREVPAGGEGLGERCEGVGERGEGERCYGRALVVMEGKRSGPNQVLCGQAIACDGAKEFRTN